ncbi:hypothetical protein F6X34_21280 [Dickeya dianthicola]|nr:hypothetical protein [Dickeya dianthicola]
MRVMAGLIRPDCGIIKAGGYDILALGCVP